MGPPLFFMPIGLCLGALEALADTADDDGQHRDDDDAHDQHGKVFANDR